MVYTVEEIPLLFIHEILQYMLWQDIIIMWVEIEFIAISSSTTCWQMSILVSFEDDYTHSFLSMHAYLMSVYLQVCKLLAELFC